MATSTGCAAGEANEHALVNGFNAHMLSLFAAQASPAGKQGHG